MSEVDEVIAAIDEVADPTTAAFLQGFFKTGRGQYGEGDRFVGVRVPVLRAIAREHSALGLSDVGALLASPVHEHRLLALVVLVEQWKVADRAPRDAVRRDELHDFYLHAVRSGRVNNWDLVDSSAEYLVGAYLLDRPAGLLDDLAASPSQWQRRVAVLSTFAFIKAGDPGPTFHLAAVLLDDPEPLMHKAVGWMLREVGKRVDRRFLVDFLDAHAGAMPRTMLSYATEHLAPEQRAAYRAIPRAGAAGRHGPSRR